MTTLPTDSEVRKTYPLFSALFGYFGAALAAVAHHSWESNEKHNPGQPVHWSIDKSTDHADCILRHLLDLGETLGEIERNGATSETVKILLEEADAIAWRALALNQTLRLKYTGAPLPFNARRSDVSAAKQGLKEVANPGTYEQYCQEIREILQRDKYQFLASSVQQQPCEDVLNNDRWYQWRDND